MLRSARTAGTPLLVTAAVAVAVAVAGCGGSSNKPNKGGSAHGQFLAFSQCMRSHGVTNFPDPSSGGGGIQIGASSGIDPSAPSFRAAQSACTHLLPGGGPSKAKPSAQLMHQMVAMSACMRAHGVADFPDPTEAGGSGPLNLNPAKYSLVEDRGGALLAVPKSIDVSSPGFQRASTACGFGGPPGGGRGGKAVAAG